MSVQNVTATHPIALDKYFSPYQRGGSTNISIPRATLAAKTPLLLNFAHYM